MKNVFCFSVFFVCVSMLACPLVAQVIVVPTGGDGDQVAYSVGQSVAGTAAGATGSAEIGVQQTYTLAVQGLELTPAMAGTKVVIYPNPTASTVRVEVASTRTSEVECSLYSDHGQLLEQHRFDPTVPLDIDMTDYPVGTYILRLEQDGTAGAGYQVIKQ